MKKNNNVIRSAVLTACLLSASGAEAVTVYYQPTPYPATVTSGVHITDGWVNDYFPSVKTFQDSDRRLGRQVSFVVEV